MAISGELFGQPKGRPGSFVFADGGRIAAREYGYFSGNNFVLAPATELFDTCFKSAELGAKFPISAFAVRLAAVPHLYFIAFHTAIYLAYAKEILGVDDTTMAEIAVGISKAVDDTRTPKGEPLAKSIKQSLISAGVSLSTAIIEDMRQASAAGPGAPKPLATSATRLLLGLIELSFVEGKTDKTVLLKGIGMEHAERLQLLDERPARVINALQSDLQLRFEAPQ
jgi:hypothetical protein